MQKYHQLVLLQSLAFCKLSRGCEPIAVTRKLVEFSFAVTSPFAGDCYVTMALFLRGEQRRWKDKVPRLFVAAWHGRGAVEGPAPSATRWARQKFGLAVFLLWLSKQSSLEGQLPSLWNQQTAKTRR